MIYMRKVGLYLSKYQLIVYGQRPQTSPLAFVAFVQNVAIKNAKNKKQVSLKVDIHKISLPESINHS